MLLLLQRPVDLTSTTTAQPTAHSPTFDISHYSMKFVRP